LQRALRLSLAVFAGSSLDARASFKFSVSQCHSAICDHAETSVSIIIERPKGGNVGLQLEFLNRPEAILTRPLDGLELRESNQKTQPDKDGKPGRM
jgi:hypothetical protein